MVMAFVFVWLFGVCHRLYFLVLLSDTSDVQHSSLKEAFREGHQPLLCSDVHYRAHCGMVPDYRA